MQLVRSELMTDDTVKLHFVDERANMAELRVSAGTADELHVGGWYTPAFIAANAPTKHLPSCGTAYRGCDPVCQKELAEKKA